MEIKIHNLRKCFGEKVAVDIADLHIGSGEILGLVGNNGAGKSTLFRLILDLLKADDGNVCMSGTHKEEHVEVDVSGTEAWKDWTGAFVDESFLIDYLTPDEYFQFVARISGCSDLSASAESCSAPRMRCTHSGWRRLPRTPIISAQPAA